MGVDTKLYISPSWTVEDIKEVIEKRFSVQTKIEFHDWSPDYVILRFGLAGAEYQRSLNIHTKTSVGGFPAFSLGLRSNQDGCLILQTLAKTFGGLYQEADTNDDFEAFSKPGEGNIDFVVKEALKDDPSLGNDSKEMASYIAEEKWHDKEVWHKPDKIKE